LFPNTELPFTASDLRGALSNICNRLHRDNRKVLLVLDDLWADSERSYLAALNFATAPERSVAGSRLLVTTRDRGTLSYEPGGARAESLHVDDPPGLTEAFARELLLRRAGEPAGAQLDAGRNTVVNELVRVCDGLPLSLAVVGGLLRRAGPAAWQGVLHDLQKDGRNRVPADVARVCEASYDALPPSLRRCFVDLAAWPPATRVLESDLLSLFAAHAPLETPAQPQRSSFASSNPAAWGCAA
jgi:NB-ARC domain